ncbi:MAG TPA: hypothetical protein VN802_08860 [Stellaceae bacterium]|nr:hypothetical protein [Stellaceae bacterium]
MKLSTQAIAAALLLCGSSLAMAQTTDQSPGTSPAPAFGSAPSAGGASAMPESMGPITTEAQVKEKLQSAGYSNIQSIRKDADGWTAKATKNGQQVAVNLDGNGNIKTR